MRKEKAEASPPQQGLLIRPAEPWAVPTTPSESRTVKEAESTAAELKQITQPETPHWTNGNRKANSFFSWPRVQAGITLSLGAFATKPIQTALPPQSQAGTQQGSCPLTFLTNPFSRFINLTRPIRPSITGIHDLAKTPPDITAAVAKAHT